MREPAFAGSFYPSDRRELMEFVDSAIADARVPAGVAKRSVSFVAPHAGYVYSGHTAAHTYKALLSSERLKAVSTIVIVGPNHTGIGDYRKPISVSLEDWKTPLGTARNDKELSRAIAESMDIGVIDETSHRKEHSIEVQLPFMHTLFDGKKFCFICMGNQDPPSSEAVAAAIVGCSESADKKVVVIASSDLNHYEPDTVSRSKDSKIIAFAEKLDHRNFNETLVMTGNTACGYGPITISMLFGAKNNASEGYILDYSNSGDETHDYSSVVSYLSMAFA